MKTAATVLAFTLVALTACTSDPKEADNTAEICKKAEEGIIREVLPVLQAAAGPDGELSDEEVAAVTTDIQSAFQTAANNADTYSKEADNEKLEAGLRELAVALQLIVNDPSQLKNFQQITASSTSVLDQECS